jgi:hypothetical protein
MNSAVHSNNVICGDELRIDQQLHDSRCFAPHCVHIPVGGAFAAAAERAWETYCIAQQFTYMMGFCVPRL